MLIFVAMKKVLSIFTLFTLFFLLSTTDVAAQCAMCKAVLESNMQSGEEAVGKGINGGIMYIMFVPYILMAVAGYFTYKHHVKNKEANAN